MPISQLSEKEQELVKETLRLILKDRTQGELAKGLGVDQTTISAILGTKNQRASLALARRLIAYAPDPPDTVESVKRDTHEETSQAIRDGGAVIRLQHDLAMMLGFVALQPTRANVLDSRYPRMEIALEMARDAGMPEDFLSDFVKQAHQSREDVPAKRWWKMMQGEYERWQLPRWNAEGELAQDNTALLEDDLKPAPKRKR